MNAPRRESSLPRPGFRGPGAMGMPVQKPKNFKTTLTRFVTYLAPHRLALSFVALAAICSTIFSVFSPKLLSEIITDILQGFIYHERTGASANFQQIGYLIILLCGLYLLSSLFSYLQQYMMAGIAQKTVYRLRRQVHEKLSHLPLQFYDNHPHGDILSRFINDFDNISNTLQQSLTQLITSVITLVGVVIMMISINLWMTLVVFVTLPLSIFAARYIATRSQKYFVGQQRVLGQLNGHVEEMYTGHTIVKAFGLEKRSLAEFESMNASLYEVGYKAQFISGIIMPVMGFIGNIGYVLVSVVGSILVFHGVIEVGAIVAFTQYSGQFSQPITQLASIANILQSTMASAERVFEILDEPEEVPDATLPQDLVAPRGDVMFKQVQFSYAKDEPLIENMNVDVLSGQMIAIVGPTGAGKTTLVNLLMRFYELQGGFISIDGVDITRLTRENLRSLFGMVLQDTWLFRGTILENIAYGRLGATREDVVRAAQAAHADHFIRTLPEGYDTMLHEEATDLSQGQKQLLTIARAILANPSILLLDEATSSVDTRTEVQIQKAMQELRQGKTSFVIAHRLSTIRDANWILVMNHGRVIEQGTHTQLMFDNGFYASLYNSQFAAAT